MGRAMPVGFNIYDYKGKYIEFHRKMFSQQVAKNYVTLEK